MSKGITTVKGQKWGCNRCAASGEGKNAMVMAANHHRQKNHPAWSEQTMHIEYGSGAGASISKQQALL